MKNQLMQRFAPTLLARATRNLTLGLLALGTSSAYAAQCEYAVVNEWSSGFQAEVSIKNTEDQPMMGWEMQWQWPASHGLSNAWNAEVECAGTRCTASNKYPNPIDPNQTFKFGFIGTKSSGQAAMVTLGGQSCDLVSAPVHGTQPNSAPQISQSQSASQATNQPANQAANQTVATGQVSSWKLASNQSSLHYVSIKKDHVAETNTFKAPAGQTPAIQGTVDKNGNAVIAIDLNDVSTGIDIRNSRLTSILFETDLLPTAYITAKVDTQGIANMPVGGTRVMPLMGELSLHAIRQTIVTDVMVVKHSNSDVSVTALKPILIDSKNFDMANGIEALRVVAKLSSITEAVPVYFQLRFNADNNAQPIAMPKKPKMPASLSASYDVVSKEATVSWLDNSNNETQFILRRKPAIGYWETTQTLTSGTTRFSEALPEEGQFDYKVIAINKGVPSEISNIASIEVTEGDQIARGQKLYAEQCVTCHGVEGKGGIGMIPGLDTRRPIEPMIKAIVERMPVGAPGTCDQQCAEDLAAFIESLWPQDAIACVNPHAQISYGARQLKILTQAEYQNTVEDLLGVDFDAASGLSADEKVGLFKNNTHSSVVSNTYGNQVEVAKTIADWSEKQKFAPALSCNQFNNACVNQFMNDLAPKLFRRTLTNGEKAAYRAIADGTHSGGDVREGIKMALTAALSSPQFMYRSEMGELNPGNAAIDANAYELTSFEMATFLAYTFTGSTPDDELFKAAQQDKLRDEAEIKKQAKRLIAGGKGKEVLGDFVGSWLETDTLEVAAKSDTHYPNFRNVVPHMEQEIRENFSHVMLSNDESFASIYDADYSFLNGPLAKHYGISGVSGNHFRKVSTSERGGILANGAFMARWAEADETSPILRSVRIRRRMLCQEQPDPPAGTFAAREKKLEELSDLLKAQTTTNKIKVHALTKDQPCSSCHEMHINPLGFGVEDFDTVGRVRTTDLKGNSVENEGMLYAPRQYFDVTESIAFVGAKGLGSTLATLESAQSCLPKQMFRNIMGVGHDSIDPKNPASGLITEEEHIGYLCEIDELTDTMMSESPRAMFEKFSVLESVRYRKAWSRQ